MASPSASALAGYLLERIKNDVHFLHSQQLLDMNERDAILSRLDGATHRAISLSSNSNTGAVAALTSQFGATTVSSSSGALVAQQQHQQQHSQPPPMPARYNPAPPPPPPQDNREKVRALWAYTGAQADDLTFQKNDIIVITQKENEHWYRGFVQTDPSARTGLFPSNYVEPYTTGGYTSPAAHSYYAASTISSVDAEKTALQQQYGQQSSSASQYYNQAPPPPQQQYYQQQPQPLQQAPSPAEPGKKPKFKMPGSGSGFGNTLAHAGVGGLGFGAGSAVASNIVNAIL